MIMVGRRRIPLVAFLYFSAHQWIESRRANQVQVTLANRHGRMDNTAYLNIEKRILNHA